MKILIIPDSFKGSLSAKEVAQLMEQCVKAVFPESESVSMPFSDGGEGALTVLQTHSTGQLIKCSAYDAIQQPIEASYFFFQNKVYSIFYMPYQTNLLQEKISLFY